ncbi:hypothetical protein MASR2M18_18840 [Ignavibacteria bacterium]
MITADRKPQSIRIQYNRIYRTGQLSRAYKSTVKLLKLYEATNSINICDCIELYFIFRLNIIQFGYKIDVTITAIHRKS